jgi:hypothetical protein
MNDSDDIWIPVAKALDLVARQFAQSARLDAAQARDEAKNSMIGDLATGHLRSCPYSYLTSSFAAGSEGKADNPFNKFGAVRKFGDIEVDFDPDSGHPVVPVEFWRHFRDPSAGANADWLAGHFSFNITEASGVSVSGSVRNLCIYQAGLPQPVEMPQAEPVAVPAALASGEDSAADTTTSAAEIEPALLKEKRRRRGRPSLAKDLWLLDVSSGFKLNRAA